jgi:hypothetical protein
VIKCGMQKTSKKGLEVGKKTAGAKEKGMEKRDENETDKQVGTKQATALTKERKITEADKKKSGNTVHLQRRRRTASTRGGAGLQLPMSLAAPPPQEPVSWATPLNKMATPEKGLQRWRMFCLQKGLYIPRSATQPMQWRSDKERHYWSSPMGPRAKGSFSKASSYLLQQLIHRHQDWDAHGGDLESSESSESETLNVEVCFPLPPHSLASPFQPLALLPQRGLAGPSFPHWTPTQGEPSPRRPFLRAPRPPFCSQFLCRVSSPPAFSMSKYLLSGSLT